VGVKPVRELLGVMAAQDVGRGIFVTTGEYTAEARTFAAGQPLELVSGAALLGKLAGLPADAPSRLLAEATAGDYTTPTCPSCGVETTLRTSRKDGGQFWGCRHYPRCRVTLRHSVPAGAAA
jgi:restriction system protein